jgi:SAM-dependent methyltransferase
MAKYNHTIGMHNLLAPIEIVPIIIDLFEPKSVVDVGCGLGTFIKIFKDKGAKKILGLDGHWCNKDLLFHNITPAEFIEIDLEQKIQINNRFDLAISLEVAEHLSPKRAKSFIEDLTNLSEVILFSAAIPNQGGDHHKNENWISYWEDLFTNYGYIKYDVLKPSIWENPNIFWWYKQNMVLFIKHGFENEKVIKLERNNLRNIIHAELFTAFADYHQKNSITRHAKLLFKSILFKVGLFN